MLPYEQLSDDELLDLGAKLEDQLQSLKNELAALAPIVEAERQRLSKAAWKLGINGVIGVGGVATAPITMGLSLAFTLGAGVMTVWDIRDFALDRSALNRLRQQTTNLRVMSANLADQLEAVSREMESRP